MVKVLGRRRLWILGHQLHVDVAEFELRKLPIKKKRNIKLDEDMADMTKKGFPNTI